MGVEEYMKYVNKSGVDLCASMADIVTDEDPSLKRVKNSVDRTLVFLDESLKLLHSVHTRFLIGSMRCRIRKRICWVRSWVGPMSRNENGRLKKRSNEMSAGL